ncbi:MAG TPA: mandelate racemase/muconate lactonizing enzyme family protein [Burkholderiaceae bacterium]
MKIERIETLQADGGYRVCSYLKLSTSDGRVGWAEYYDGFSGVSLAPVIEGFGRAAIGMDPRQYARVSESLLATTRLAAGGLAHQAIAAIENACLDVCAKFYGVPVYALFGGPFRDRVGVYWTHCGSYRVRHAAFYERIGMPLVRSLDDFERMGREAAQAGFKVLKTNPVFFGAEGPQMINGGFRIAPGFLDRSLSEAQIDAIVAQLTALRRGAGPGMGLMLDVSFSQRTEGYLRLARRLEEVGLYWLELDIRDPDALARIRDGSRTPIASLESLHGVADYRPFLAGRTVDTAIVDPLWNGVYQSLRIATLADAFETHVAPHNPVGELGNLMSAHFCAAAPNVRIMELRPDEAPWTRDFVTHLPVVEDGELLIPDRPGWGAEVNEAALRAHPPRRP